MTIYVDIVFIENVLINYIIFVATAFISRNKIKPVPFFMSSIIGGLYSILNYIIKLTVLENIIFKILLSVLMIQIGFYKLKLKKFLKVILFFI